LGVEKLSFRVAHLSLFADGNHLWADESTVTYLGPDGEGSQVDRTGRPPADAPEARLVTPPRVPPRGGGIRARTFARFVPLPGLGTPSGSRRPSSRGPSWGRRFPRPRGSGSAWRGATSSGPRSPWRSASR